MNNTYQNDSAGASFRRRPEYKCDRCGEVVMWEPAGPDCWTQSHDCIKTLTERIAQLERKRPRQTA